MRGNRSRLATFVAELRRRRVIRAVVIYAVVAWALIQIAETTFPSLELPGWTITLVIALVVLGFPILLVLAWAYDLTATAERKIVRTGPTPPGVGGNGHRKIESIAVLPFADMSPEADLEYFADGIAEELLNTLTRCCGYAGHLRVPARTSCFAFKGKNLDVREIGERLGVDAVVEGSVRRAGDQLRISAQLVDVRDGYHVWSEQYDRRMQDLFAIQDDIAGRVVEALDVSLTRPEQERLGRKPPTDVRAYEYYLRGRHLFHQITRHSVEAARGMFELAIDIDPGYARAHAGRADCYSYLYSFWEHTPENLRRADDASKEALRLHPTLSEAHVARAGALQLQGRVKDAADEFERAIELNPALFEAYYFYARSAFSSGDYGKAIHLFGEAHKARPEDYQSLVLKAIAYRDLGDAETADAVDRQALDVILEHLALNPDDARAYYMGASCWASVGQRERAYEWINQALALEPDDAVIRYGVGCNYARLGDADRALANLARALELGFGYREWIEHDADWLLVRDTPRFKALLETLPRGMPSPPPAASHDVDA